MQTEPGRPDPKAPAAGRQTSRVALDPEAPDRVNPTWAAHATAAARAAAEVGHTAPGRNSRVPRANARSESTDRTPV